jgi:GntR family transcriptional regulator, rspAB operon transcriptional repressor
MARKLSANILDHIKSRILNFSLLPGVKISDEEIAKVFGTSRSPVREALNRLVEQELVEYRPNRGFTVKVFTRKEVADHYVLREALESLAVRLAAQSMGHEEVKSLEDLLETYPAVMKSQDLARFNECDERFHDLIALYSGNASLHKALRNLHGIIRIIRRYDHIRAGNFQDTFEEHQLILKHMIAKDAPEAVRLMSLHIIKSMELVMPIVPERS